MFLGELQLARQNPQTSRSPIVERVLHVGVVKLGEPVLALQERLLGQSPTTSAPRRRFADDPVHVGALKRGQQIRIAREQNDDIKVSTRSAEGEVQR